MMTIRRSVFVAVLVGLTAAGSTLEAAIPPSERAALIALYNSTQGPGWADDTGWLGSEGTECSWFGVTCNAGETAVVELDLAANGLSGQLPGGLSALTSLEILDLEYNSIGGAIPPDLGSLPSLRVLGLFSNDWIGAIPSELGNLTTLEVLSIESYLPMTPAPIPSSFAGLTSLQDLTLLGCRLTGGLPSWLGNLTTLRILRLNDNLLSGSIPASFAQLTQLEILGLDDNSLSGPIPDWIGGFTNLWSLGLGGNALSGTIPDSIGNLAGLRELALDENQLTGTIPASIGNLGELEYLSLESNELTGSIPATIGDLAKATVVVVADNQLSGRIPDSIGGLAALEYLYLEGNSLDGPIPESVGSLANLKYLWLQDNELEGPLPASIGGLVNLFELDARRNRLEGPLPASIGSLSGLYRLYLSSNRITGEIPAEIVQLPHLQTLRLDWNGLWTGDAAVDVFVTSKNPGWKSSQTIAPGAVGLSRASSSLSVGSFWAEVTWSPIAFVSREGQYQVWVADAGDGESTRRPATSEALGKSASSAIVGPLRPGASYGLSIRAATFAHADNLKNAVLSDPSSVVTVTTQPALTYYVATGGSDAADCLSEETACATIQAAIGKAADGSLVNVGPGTYPERVVIDKDLYLLGSGAWRTIIDAEDLGSAIDVASGRKVAVVGFQLTRGAAAFGGGVSAGSGSTVWVLDTELETCNGGGGVAGSAADLMVSGSTFYINHGPSVWLQGGTVTVSNSTFTSNYEIDGGIGGLEISGEATVVSTTIARNGGTSNGVGLKVLSGKARLFNSVLVGNGAISGLTNCAGSVFSMGRNIESGSSCGLVEELGDLPLVSEPVVQNLEDNGGPTRTMRPYPPPAVAIDRGDDAVAPELDQRGLRRPRRLGPDIGAVELLPTGTFGDVAPQSWAERYIEGLVAEGITVGCGGGMYCPDNDVTRAQMAVFLLKGEHGPTWQPPAATGVFLDVPLDYWAAAWIETLAVEGITVGCGGDLYCPETPVSRDQMAVFLLKTEHGSSWQPPPAVGVFDDVPVGHWAAPWIEALAAEAITAGCSDTEYCPDNPVTRAQMAVFLVKTFRLPR